MKILSLNNYHFLRGGSERYFLDQKSLLEAHGHEVVTFSTRNVANERLSPGSRLVEAIDTEKPRASDIARFMYSRRNGRELRELVAEYAPRAAHLHIYYGQLTASILGALRKAGVPIVQTLHEYRLFCPVSTFHRDDNICDECVGNQFWRAAVNRCNRRSLARSMLSAAETYVSHFVGAERAIDRFIAVSDFQRLKLIDAGIPASKICTIHNFKDVSRITPAVGHGRHFLYFGRLERLKGLFTLLDAAADLPDVPLIIAGEGTARTALERVVSNRGLDHVSFVGFQSGDSLDELIRDSICTVLPSEWWETFGLTTLESFACGRPVVASRIGGIPEVITHGQDGLLVEPGSPEQLREQLEWMASHRDRAAEMGIEGRRTVERRFNPDIHYRKLLDVYSDVTSN